MLNHHGVLVVALALVTLTIMHHVSGGIHRADFQVSRTSRYHFHDWVEGRRLLRAPAELECASSDKESLLQKRRDELLSHGRGDYARIINSQDGKRLLLEGYLRGMAVIYSPCEGTYIEPTFAPTIEGASGSPQREPKSNSTQIGSGP